MIYGERIVKTPIRWGMVGGGYGGQIGYSHRSAALRDFGFDLLAGAFDIDYERGKAFGAELHVDTDRCYPDYKTMFEAEAKRTDGIQAVSIATPNFTHFEISKCALESGLHVICEKPLCFTVQEARELLATAEKKNRVFAVTYGYSGYQMIEEARQLIANGNLGEIRIVNMQFAHGYNNTAVESDVPGQKWRVDPKFAGPSFVLGDVGTHVLYLAEVMVPDLKIIKLICTRQSFVKSRAPLEDNAYTIMKYSNGAVGTVWSSSVNAGSMHSQKIRVIGEKASVEWWDEHPNQLVYEVQGKPSQTLERGMGYLSDETLRYDRLGGGHAEGYFEAWSNLYRKFAWAMIAKEEGKSVDFWYPDIKAGLEGVRWVENCVRSADNGETWVDYQ